MNETLRLSKINNNSTLANLVCETPVLEGTEAKDIVCLEIGNRSISMLRRTLDPEFSVPELIGFNVEEFSLAEKYIVGITALQQRGLPVPQTARLISENQVAVTNVVANGGSIYDVKAQAMKKMFYTKNKNSEIFPEDKFFSVLDTNLISCAANKITEAASSTSVLIAEDSPYHLVFYPDGSWTIMILDIAKMKIGKSEKDMNFYLEDFGISLENYNKLIAERWVKSVMSLHSYLQSNS